jgi:hypothetical protein
MHLNGFAPGDPEIFERSERYPASAAPRRLNVGLALDGRSQRIAQYADYQYTSSSGSESDD